MPAPRLGEHNAFILRDRLGRSEQELAELEKEKVIGTVPEQDTELTPEMVREMLTAPLSMLQEVGAIIRVEPDYLEQLGLKEEKSD